MEGEKRLERPRQGRMLAGVCAAFAKYFEMDVTIVRLIYAVLTVCTAFCGIIVYFIAAFIIPQEKNKLLKSGAGQTDNGTRPVSTGPQQASEEAK